MLPSLSSLWNVQVNTRATSACQFIALTCMYYGSMCVLCVLCVCMLMCVHIHVCAQCVLCEDVCCDGVYAVMGYML